MRTRPISIEKRAETVGVERRGASELEQGHGTHEVYPSGNPYPAINQLGRKTGG